MCKIDVIHWVNRAVRLISVTFMQGKINWKVLSTIHFNWIACNSILLYFYSTLFNLHYIIEKCILVRSRFSIDHLDNTLSYFGLGHISWVQATVGRLIITKNVCYFINE